MILMCPFMCKRPVAVKVTLPTEHGESDRVYCQQHGEQVAAMWREHFTSQIKVEAWSSESCGRAPRSRDGSSPSPASD